MANVELYPRTYPFEVDAAPWRIKCMYDVPFCVFMAFPRTVLNIVFILCTRTLTDQPFAVMNVSRASPSCCASALFTGAVQAEDTLAQDAGPNDDKPKSCSEG